jgi:cyclophilin family peptidyl-prolyl cis-trans isomerase
MLSTGLDRNDSRFIITTVEDAPHLDGKYVAFGRVKEGMEVLDKLVKNTFTKKGRPTLDIQVVKSGVL